MPSCSAGTLRNMCLRTRRWKLQETPCRTEVRRCNSAGTWEWDFFLGAIDGDLVESFSYSTVFVLYDTTIIEYNRI